MKQNEEFLTKNQIKTSRIIIGVSAFLLGLFLLLTGLQLFPFTFKQIILASILFFLSLICLILAFIQQNSLLLWLFPIFLLCGLVSVLSSFTPYSYSNLYPIYIIAPCVSSIITPIYTKNYKDHIKVIILFLISFILFSLNAFFNLSWTAVISLFICFLGIAIILSCFIRRKKDD